MAGQIQSIRGINDVLPAEEGLWTTLDHAAEQVFGMYGYHRIRLPIMEQTALFKRAVGEVTDIVEKEMYTFTDRGGDSVSLRPEGTAGVVRAGVEHGLFHNQSPRLWYTGPMFRYERPQKGRYRQFHQFGVENFGQPGPDVDIELIAMSARLFKQLGIDGLTLEINTLGTPEERAAWREALHEYFAAHVDALDDDSRRRLDRNPLRILDSKNPAMADLVADAPTLRHHLGAESADHFERLCRGLESLRIHYEINTRLVRGLDYYTRTVFEWITEDLGAQDAVCSGGRFDGLVSQLGGRETPALGFALGVERLVELMRARQVPLVDVQAQVYLVHAGEATARQVSTLAESLRDAIPGLRLQVNAGGGSFKSQFKRADRSGARVALVFGEDEAANNTIQIKPMAGQSEQQQVPLADVAGHIHTILSQAPSPTAE